ncbi:hypothetical protein BDP27DRAFT_1357756 [Rhodocollybia butyracea]|uniref:Uncharacterized protein n=1 Tax=Rhodocollybia butyracea TaxID=206335 RepID=A0A9P5Q852_9AGAR|nr:hypothetical protein BDP27DRAFT_1357756 [Rhodocollybia butyracea]
MSLSRLYEDWIGFGFYSRFSAPSSKEEVSTRPTTTRSSTWEEPLAKSTALTLCCEPKNVFEDSESDTLCAEETRDMLTVDASPETKLKTLDRPLYDCGYNSGENPASSDEEALVDEPEFDVSLDNDVLHSWTTIKNIIVLDSTNPQLTPHIVITPASDTFSDLAIAWFNQISYQYTERLSVPFPDYTENPSPIYVPTNPLSPMPSPKRVFSLSRFNAMIESCSDERLNYFNVVVTLRRQTVKAVVFIASHAAIAYRERYDITLPFSSIERPFSWSDPAEPVLLASQHHRATLIIDSPNPYRVPHIIINQPPPENDFVTAINILNDPQDYGFGRYLVVYARGINYINEPEDAYAEFDSYEIEDYYSSRSDEEEYDEWIECGVDQEEDYGEGYCSTLDCYSSFEDSPEPELDTESLSSLESPSPETPDSMDDDDFTVAFERALEQHTIVGGVSLTDSYAGGYPLDHPPCNPSDKDMSDRPKSRWVDDDDDDLPPLDDEWYQSVIRRTQSEAAV